jgi:hypothetical protein
MIDRVRSSAMWKLSGQGGLASMNFRARPEDNRKTRDGTRV